MKEDYFLWGNMVKHDKGKILYEFDMMIPEGKIGVVDKDGKMAWVDWIKLEELHGVKSVI